MNTSRFQSAKNLQPARSLKTPAAAAQNRNGGVAGQLPLTSYQNAPPSPQQQRHSNGSSNGSFGSANGNGYRSPQAASNGFNGGYPGAAAMIKNGHRRHDVLRSSSQNSSFGSNVSVGSSGSSGKEIHTIATFRSTTLAVGSMHEVYVSYVENGPKLFTVQLRATENSLNQMMGALERVPLRNLTRKPTLGMACIARFSEDQVLYRALIMGINVDSCVVSYVDYGNSETVEFKNLYEIPAEYLKHKVFSMRFTLSNVKTLEDTNADIAGIFSSLVMDKLLSMKIMPLEGPAFVQYCELYEQNENIFDKLLNMCKAKPLKYPLPLTLDRGHSCVIIIRYIESCKQFYIQPLDKVESFEKMMDSLVEFCRKSLPMNSLKSGDPCAACLDEEECYRAEAINVTSSSVKVRLVDYGNTMTLKRNQIKRLSPAFVEKQPQVAECCLEGFQDTADESLSTAQLEMLAENESGERKQFKLIVSEVQNGVAVVNLFDEATTPVLNVAKRLLKLKNPAKFVKELQALQQKPPVTAPAKPAPINSKNPFHSTSIISEVPNLSQTTPPRMAESEVIDLTNDDQGGFVAQPIGHHSSGYDNQSVTTPSNYSGSYRGPARSETSARSGRDSLNSSYGSVKKERFPRQDVPPRFVKDRNQTPYYVEHDDRCAADNSSSYEEPKSREKVTTTAQRGASNRGSGSESGFNTQSAERANSSHDNSFKSSTASIDMGEDFVGYEFAFAEQVIPMNTKVEVKLVLWISPEEFYVRMKDEEDKFEEMMKQVQKFYKGRPAVGDVPPVGSAVVARYQKHNALYRARVIKYNEVLAKFKVELLDQGNKVIVSNPELWKVDRRFTKLPMMAIQCSLANIKLNCDAKELLNKIDKYVSGEPIECVFLDKGEDSKYVCDVDVQGADLKMALLKDNLIAQILTDIDLNRLKGQTLKLKLVEMKGLDLFRIKILGNDAVLNCRLVEHRAYDQSIVEELRRKWLDQYLFGLVEDVSSDELLILTLLISPLSTQSPPTIVDMPVLQSKFNAFVTYVHEANCLYVQNSRWTPEVGKLLDDLFEYYEKSGEVITNLQMNELCASKSADGNWYRAKIISLQDVDNIEVQFVDYGNRECVRHEDLKVLEAQFREFSAFAHQVYLPMACLNEGEEDKLKLAIAELTGEYELELTVLDYRNDVWIVDITSNDYSIVQALKDKQLVKDLDHEEIVNRKSTVAAAVGEGLEVASNGAESDAKCDTGRLMAYVSHVDNPNQLFIQMNSDLEDIDTLQENLQIIAQALPQLKDFSVNRHCIAPFSADELWYRARIIDSHDDLIIQFVDYGNSDVITSNKKTELKDINDSLMNFKIYAKQCSLLVSPAKGRKNWSEEATMILRDLQEVEVQILAESQGVSYITLKSGERDLAEELVAKQLAIKMEYVPSDQRCFTSHIESIREFYLQLERDINPLDVMADYMARFEEFAVVESPEVGGVYVAEFPDDGLWYRAKVMDKLPEKRYEVFFLDYGNTSEISNVRELEKSIAELPPLCTKCTLRLPEGLKSWSDDAESKFRDIAANGETVFTVHLHTPGSIATVELLLDGVTINDQLKGLCEKGVANMMNASFILNEEKTLDDSAPLGGYVTISHINSPADFYIHFKNTALEGMEELLNKATKCERLPENELCEGMYCLAYVATRNKYYRARIVHIVDGKYKVQMVDYGTIEFATDLRKIPQEIENISLLAKKCCLEGYSPNDNVLDVVKQRFTALADQGRAQFVFEMVETDHEPNIIRLFTPEGRNVDDLLECSNANGDEDAANNNSSSKPPTSTVSIAPPPPAPADLVKTSSRAKSSRQAFFRAKSDLEFDQ
ncbi:maternal protein tudor [Culex pipiens pallens]|uniref:maternal protein tudor n=1 Tax=Culex pipiens pallens TaxID=42434 RepID=UPI001953FEB9|nr:maternal protein tudor [Culex pipiens pallens]